MPSPSPSHPSLDAPLLRSSISTTRLRRVCAGASLLVVDDEATICRLLQRTLRDLGHRVETFTSPREALDRFARAPLAYDAVVTDLSMPGLDGITLARTMLDIRGRLPILLLTGFRHDWTDEKVRALGMWGVLDKPVSIDDLARALDGALERSPQL